MDFNYDMKDVSDFTLSFTVEQGEIHWSLGGLKKSNDFISQELKSQLPKKKIFKINSLIYNVETQVNDINISFDCSYNDESNILSIIINDEVNHKNLTKEVAMTLFLFVQKVQIEKLYLILALKNPNYILLLQEMMTLGFQSEKSARSTQIDGNAYKILFIETKDMTGNIEEFGFGVHLRYLLFEKAELHLLKFLAGHGLEFFVPESHIHHRCHVLSYSTVSWLHRSNI